MKDHTRVQCGQHGEAMAAYVCQHMLAGLRDRQPRGVHWTRDDDGCVNAWCDLCEEFVMAHGGEWNDETEAHASIRLICEGCFQRFSEFDTLKEVH